jgi:hypothetical protein
MGRVSSPNQESTNVVGISRGFIGERPVSFGSLLAAALSHRLRAILIRSAAMMTLECLTARDDLAESELLGDIGIILTQKYFEKQRKRLISVGVYGRIRVLVRV